MTQRYDMRRPRSTRQAPQARSFRPGEDVGGGALLDLVGAVGGERVRLVGHRVQHGVHQGGRAVCVEDVGEAVA